MWLGTSHIEGNTIHSTGRLDNTEDAGSEKSKAGVGGPSTDAGAAPALRFHLYCTFCSR